MNGYIAAAAKVRSLFGEILNEGTYDDLLSKKNVSEVAGYLKSNKIYKEALSANSSSEFHRGDLEILLRKQFVMETNRIYKHITNENLSFFYDFNLEFEISILKNILRCYLTEGRWKYNYIDLSFEKGRTFNFADLVSSVDIDELIMKIRKTKMSKYILPLVSEKNPALIHAIETNLDLYYFDNIYKSAEKHLEGADLEFIKHYLGTKADLYNIFLILRMKKYFRWTRDRIIPYIVNHYEKLSPDFISKLADSKDAAECIDMLKKTIYANIAGDSGFDILMKKYYFAKYMPKIRQSIDFRTLIYYFKLKKIDIDNLITITESVRYGYGKEETKDIIVYK